MAFLVLASIFAEPRLDPEARTACAPFLVEGSRTLARLLGQPIPGEG